jgi:pyruvate formate lyase activating enzyme
MERGIIFDFQRFSLHDGPGIRTTIFLKGCPLKCLWCHNPESQAMDLELAFTLSKCFYCGKCLEVCPEKAVQFENPQRIDRSRCTVCGLCVALCPTGALEVIGKEVTVEELVREVEKDRPFYEESGGGVTISGGEPLAQFDFTVELVRRLKARDFHVALDTSGYAEGKEEDWNKLKILAELVDLVLYDIKLLDTEKHRYYVGVENRGILENARRLFHLHPEKLFLRYPLIPGVNDGEGDIVCLQSFLKGFPGVQVEILPYHRLGVGKYSRIGKEYTLSTLLPPTEEAVARVRKRLSETLPEVVVK